MKFFNGKFILFCWKFIVSDNLYYVRNNRNFIIDVYENVITIQHLVIISDNITSIYSIMQCRNIFMNVLRISTLTNDKRGLRAISCYALSLITKLWKFANGRFNASFISSIIKIHLSCCKRLYYVYVYICTTSKLFKFIQILSHICKFSNPKFATMMEPHIL